MTRNGSLPSTVEGTGISQAAGDARYAQLGSANTFSPSAQTFAAGVNLGYQSFNENAVSSGTISLTGGVIVEITGGTPGFVLQLPNSPPTGSVFCIIISATSGITLSGSTSGKTIGGVSGVGVSPGQTFWIGYNGTGWLYLSFPPHVATSITAAMGFTQACLHSGAESHSGAEVFTGACTHSGSETFSGNISHSGVETFSGTLTSTGKFVRAAQNVSAGGTISSTAGSLATYSGIAGQTINLPSSGITNNMQITVKDESGFGFTLGRNTHNIDGAASDLTIGAYGTVTLYYNNGGAGVWYTI